MPAPGDNTNSNEPSSGSGTPQSRAGGGPMTLGGQPVDSTLPEGWGQPARPKTGRVGDWSSNSSQRRPGEAATLFNSGIRNNDGPAAQRGMPGGFRGGSEGSDDDEDDRREGETTYAGGERSGLAIQAPDQPRAGGRGNNIVDSILRQAAETSRSRAEQAAETAGTGSAFRGTGNTLGSDETPSVAVGVSPSSPAARGSTGTQVQQGSGARGWLPSDLAAGGMEAIARMFPRSGGSPPEDDDEDDDDGSAGAKQVRRLTFWRNGFSIEDGPLMAYDAPGNKELLQAIEAGRAPPSVFGVRYNQRVDIEVAQRRNEDYVQPPKRPMRPFEGGGNRLGSPAPDVAGTSSGRASPAPQSILQGGSGSGASTTQPKSPEFEVDTSKPTTNIQIRLADGTKLVAKVNLTHSVSDLRNYVSAARPDTRPFVLQTTFPSKELTDLDQTVEGAKLQGSVIVQRYT